nr:hypothetical protein [Tanacetum cinerariifolium]
MIDSELQPRVWHSQTLQPEDVSNNLNLSSKRNVELNVGRFWRIMLGMVGGGICASPDVVIVAMVEGV